MAGGGAVSALGEAEEEYLLLRRSSDPGPQLHRRRRLLARPRAGSIIIGDHDTVPIVESIAISEFKATCLAVLERVRQSGQPILVTRRGEPMAEIVPPSPAAGGGSWLGSARGTGEILGDLVAPAADPQEWEALRP